MSNRFSILAAALVAACLVFASPGTSRAQSYGGRHGASSHGHRGHGHGGYRGYGYRGYGYGYRGYGGHGGYGYGRPIIVHPEYYHWTPYRGWHSHGHLHVPHRGHSHRIPY